jgi:hypothetical protein
MHSLQPDTGPLRRSLEETCHIEQRVTFIEEIANRLLETTHVVLIKFVFHDRPLPTQGWPVVEQDICRICQSLSLSSSSRAEDRTSLVVGKNGRVIAFIA